MSGFPAPLPTICCDFVGVGMSTAVGALLQSVVTLLKGALALDEASLVILRRGALVEYKTRLLDAEPAVSTEGGHQSWQVGPYEGHHCHLDLTRIVEIWFDAESVSCQGGRTNYTVWFLSSEDCGNPYRPNGVFSVTLNAPYARDGRPRTEVIDPVYSLYDATRHLPGVSGSRAFEDARPPTLAPICWD